MSSENTWDPNWWRQAVIYQIYPRSFRDTDGNGIGDLNGIIEKIPYLASLNIDAVWLSPFYPSALADGGYDVDDYRDVDPKIGTLLQFDVMVKELAKHNIKVFVDIVPNHSSNLHVWFQEALASPEGSPARDRYIFRNGSGPNGDLPPNHWPSHFAPSAWTRTTNHDGTPGQWYMHLFAPEQPDFNWKNPEVWEDFRKTLRFWSDRGVAGFRIDVAHALMKDMSEPYRDYPKIREFDNPLSGDDVLFDRNEVHEVYRDWRKVFNEYNPPRVAVAEAYVRVERRVLYARPDELGQAFNFDLLEADYDAAQYKKRITDAIMWAEKEGSSTTWVLENHDRIRIASKYGLPKGLNYHEWINSNGTSPVCDEKLGLQRAKAAMAMLFALPGCTYIYQGQELGLQEVADIPEGEIQDPQYLRNLKKFKGRDGVRVPLPWKADAPFFGFSDKGSHLPQPSWFKNVAVDVQERDGSTLSLFRKIISLRKSLQTEEKYEWHETGDPEVLHFSRPNGWHCIHNFEGKPFSLPAGEIILQSAPFVDGKLGPATTVWLKK